MQSEPVVKGELLGFPDQTAVARLGVYPTVQVLPKSSEVPVLAPARRPLRTSGVPVPKTAARLLSSDMICSMMKATLGSTTCLAVLAGAALKISLPALSFTEAIP